MISNDEKTPLLRHSSFVMLNLTFDTEAKRKKKTFLMTKYDEERHFVFLIFAWYIWIKTINDDCRMTKHDEIGKKNKFLTVFLEFPWRTTNDEWRKKDIFDFLY